MSLIHQHISKLGITQDEFAKRFAVSPQAVSSWILRQRIPKPRMVRRLAAELQVPVEKLVADLYR